MGMCLDTGLMRPLQHIRLETRDGGTLLYQAQRTDHTTAGNLHTEVSPSDTALEPALDPEQEAEGTDRTQ